MKNSSKNKTSLLIIYALGVLAAASLAAALFGAYDIFSKKQSGDRSAAPASGDLPLEEAYSLMHHPSANTEELLADLTREFEGTNQVDTVQYIEALVAYASVLNANNKTNEAEEALKKALEATDHTPQVEPKKKAALLFRLATVNARSKRFDTAIEHFEQAARQYDPLNNADRRSIEIIRLMEWSLLKRKGDYEKALRSAIDTAKITYGTNHITVGRGLYHLGLYLEEEGNLLEAQKNFLESLTIHEEILGADHPALVTFNTHLASLLRRQGKHDEAIRYLEKSLASTHQIAERENPRLQKALSKMSLSVKQETEIEVRSAIDESAAQFGPNHPRTVNAIRYYAMFLQSAGRFHEAEQSLKYVLALQEKAPEKNPGDQARTLLQLAECYRATDNDSGALVLVRQALELVEHHFGRGTPQTMPFVYNLALSLENNRQYPAAEHLLQHTYSYYKDRLEPGHDFLVTLEKHIEDIYLVQGKTPPPLLSGNPPTADIDAEGHPSKPCLLER